MNTTTRRRFLQSPAAVAGTSLIATNAHAGGKDVLKVGLIGFGKGEFSPHS